MKEKRTALKGLRGNYQSTYTTGDVVFRKYKKEWHIYTSRTKTPYGARTVREQTICAPNSISYVNAHSDLSEALKRAGKPLSNINDKIDNERYGLVDIIIKYNSDDGNITGHEIKVKTPEDIKLHKEIVKERLETYHKIPIFGAFLSFADYKLTYELSKPK